MNRIFGIFIDSNIFISYSRREDKNHKECKDFIDSIVNKFSKATQFRFFASRFSGVETASALRRKKSKKDAEAFLFKKENMWKNAFLPLPPNPKEKFQIEKFITELIDIALRFGTDFSDTLQTQAIENYKDQIDYIITEDDDFKNRLKKRYKRIKIYSLKDDPCKTFNEVLNHKNDKTN